jgi:hypothetical protein
MGRSGRFFGFHIRTTNDIYTFLIWGTHTTRLDPILADLCMARDGHSAMLLLTQNPIIRVGSFNRLVRSLFAARYILTTKRKMAGSYINEPLGIYFGLFRSFAATSKGLDRRHATLKSRR